MPRRMNWGCGQVIAHGWINSDIVAGEGVDIRCDILQGFPLEDDYLDYISSQHGLQDLRIYDQIPAMKELRRVLKPRGVLRLALPDFDRAIDSYRAGRQDHFLVRDWDTLSGNFITHVLWHNLTQTLFTYSFAEELLKKAGFDLVRQVGFRETLSNHAEIVELDARKDESFFLEAVK